VWGPYAVSKATQHDHLDANEFINP
jgi:hypothetical protein